MTTFLRVPTPYEAKVLAFMDRVGKTAYRAKANRAAVLFATARTERRKAACAAVYEDVLWSAVDRYDDWASDYCE